MPPVPTPPVSVAAPALSALDDAGLERLLAGLGEAPWRARQIRRAGWQPFVRAFEDVRQLPAGLRERLAAELRFSTATIASERLADRGMTIKLLCALGDAQTVETVAMESPARGASARRATVCVSTQVGCAVGCPFCATGRMGLRRSCTAAEVVDQVRLAAQALHRHGLGPVSHVVYMGMGEPLAAYETTVASVRALASDGGISPRRITVSTSGVVAGIRRLASEELPVTLAVSLHAATDELRDRLVPLNRAHPLDALVASAGAYARASGRRLSLEWCLIGGVNDGLDQAAGLVRIARRLRAHVNVIPMNRIDGSPWGPPRPAVSRTFLSHLSQAGLTVTVRDTRGGEAEAACGQLRAALEPRRRLRPDGTLGPQRPARPRG
ncbi:MAG: 23S rRNA (adenine(2503)-C(2))-methyltransferase RlmN [Candidatus Dormibacteria bacterium]